MVRALAMGDVDSNDWLKVLGRKSSFLLPSARLWALRSGAWLGSLRAGGCNHYRASMVIAVLIASVVGIAVPLALDRFGLDPAAASSPFVTSVADITGVLVYLSMAKWVLGLG